MPPFADHTPVLVTGMPRSGTSWAGKMLEASGELVYVNEPLNPQHPPGRSPGVLRATVRHRYEYIHRGNDAEWLPAFTDTVSLRYHPLAELRRNHGPYDVARCVKYGSAFAIGRLRGRRALLDDPFALMSVPWMVDRLGATAVIMVRDPVSVVGSWRALGWQGKVEDLLAQPALLRDQLIGYEDRLRASGELDPIGRICLLWCALNSAVHRMAALPGVMVCRYEDMVADPVARYADVYAACGLTWSDKARARVVAATTGGTAEGRAFSFSGLSRTAFRPMPAAATLEKYRTRLTSDEVNRVRDLTAEVARLIYPEQLG